MPVSQEIETIYDVVKKYLILDKKFRDSDHLLSARIWCAECGGEDALRNMSAMQFLTKYSIGRYTSFESISRARRKIQEEIPELRGSKWKERQEHQDNVKDVIKKL